MNGNLDAASALKAEVRRLLRRTGKGAAAAALHYSGARALLAAAQRRAVGGRRVLILSYHRVVGTLATAGSGLPTLNISQATFRKQLEQLLTTHDITSLDEALPVLAGTRRARRDLAVITFDDGYRDVYEHAFPVMRELGVTGVSYVPSRFVGTRGMLGHDRLWPALRYMAGNPEAVLARLPPAEAGMLRTAWRGGATPNLALERLIATHSTRLCYRLADLLDAVRGGPAQPEPGQLAMSWEMLRELAAAGWEIGGHTAEHTVITHQPLAEARSELAECKATLEEGLGTPVRHFAYCNGYYSAAVARALADDGWTSAVTTEDLPNVPGVDWYALKRKVLWEASSLGLDGSYSPAVTACQFDDVFGMLSLQKAVPGLRPAPATEVTEAPQQSAG